MVAVVLPLVVSTVLLVKLPLPVSEPSASTAAAPLSTAVPAVRAVMVKVLASTMVTISYSWFRTAAVMLPPRVEQLEKVTKSPSSAAWDGLVTVMVELPLLAAKVIPPGVVVARTGVMS